MSPSYRKRLKARRLERSRKGVAARLEKLAAERAGAPIRETRHVEITIRDSMRTMTVIRLHRDDGGDGRWGRWRGIGSSKLGPNGVAKLLAKLLE